MAKQEEIMEAGERFPERWQQLWDTCEQGAEYYTRGMFVIRGKGEERPRQKTQGQIIAELLKSEPMGYLS